MRWNIVYFGALFLLFCRFTFSQETNLQKFIRKGSTLICDKARFQFLTPSLVRMEFSPSGRFVDAPTAIVLRRSWPEFAVSIEEVDGWLVARTEKLALHYLLNSERFTKDNLRITWQDRQGQHAWKPGDKDDRNLGGIVHSLDGVSKKNLPPFPPGLLSRNGYFLLDDSRTPIWDEASRWIASRAEKDNQDWYFFVYGRDYGHVLQEYAELCGKIPMIPRYALGAWITDLNYEYLPGSDFVQKYRYSDEDIKKLILRFREENIPLDILVLDFAWHLYGWKGGYDWSAIFPEPKQFLDWAHQHGLKVSLNDHPGYGKESVLSDNDSHAAEIRRELNRPAPPKPSLYLDISKDWRFQIDPEDNGVARRWFLRDFDDRGWKTVDAGMSWEAQGFSKYDGFAWYRKWVSIPKEWNSQPCLLIFGGVDDMYDLYVNDEHVAHHGAQGSSVWNQMTWTDVSAHVRFGERNLIALRVFDWGGGGGITQAPVALADRCPAEGLRFNLADKRQAEAFMKILHHPLMDEGVDFWWVDGGHGSCEMEGLNSQMWTNRVYYDFTEKHTNQRGFLFGRYGGWGNHRYPAFFTGDTYSEWEVLAYQIPFTAAGGNVLMPYITHDIGGFLGRKIDFDLYARWVQFGVFSPLLRLHCAWENPRDGNLRMPWIYGRKGVELVREFFRLRYRLIPYIYTYCRIAHDTALPLVRPLYLEYPELEKAYSHPDEYFFGRELLVAPMAAPGNRRDIYLPPGQWIDYFTGQTYPGEQLLRYKCPLDRIPVFVKAGSILPLQPEMAYSDERPLDTLIVQVYGPGRAEFNLYEDDGSSLGYRTGEYAWTAITEAPLASGTYQITIGPTKGEFKGQVEKRAYRLELHGLPKPQSVELNDHALPMARSQGEGWYWDERKSITRIALNARSLRESIRLVVK